MTAIYVIIKILTFPGAITKAFFEQIMCRIFRCPVEDNRYLRTDEMCGHVEHELIEKPAASYFYCLVPGLLNFSLAVSLSWFPIINIVMLGNYTGFVAASPLLSKIITEPILVQTVDFLIPFFFVWLCVSLLSNLFPLYEDALVMKEQYGKLNKAAKVIFFPGYIIMRAGAWLEKYSLTFVILAVITFLLAIAKP